MGNISDKTDEVSPLIFILKMSKKIKPFDWSFGRTSQNNQFSLAHSLVRNSKNRCVMMGIVINKLKILQTFDKNIHQVSNRRILIYGERFSLRVNFI